MSDKKKDVVQESIPPMGLRMIAREFKKDKIAIFSIRFTRYFIVSYCYRCVIYRPR